MNVRRKGRGSWRSPRNRFEALAYEPDGSEGEDPNPTTEFLKDHTRTIISYNDSPDVAFDASVNPYRGCEHGCAYCFARPNHEYLGFSAGLDFETQILIKMEAPQLLRAELAASSWRPQPIAMSGATDPYQPVERRLGLTRQCLEVLEDYRNPVVIITKNELVTRDRDVLGHMANWRGSVVFLSLTTLESSLGQKMEPRASTPANRLRAIEELASIGVPVGVLVAPVIPGLTDHEIPSILAAGANAGARFAGYIPLRLPYGVAELFEEWLETHFPNRKRKVLSRLHSLRGGRPNDPNFGTRMRGEGPYAHELRDLFALGRRQAGLEDAPPPLSVSEFQIHPDDQRSLFR